MSQADTGTEHEHWMRQALALAEQAAALDEVPVGAVLVAEGRVVGRGCNRQISNNDPTAHAEILAIRDAAQALSNYRLPGTTLYVTLEPCTMCLGAMIHARIGTLVFASREPRFGAVVSGQRLLDEGSFNHRIDWYEGVLAESSSQLLKQFFKARR